MVLVKFVMKTLQGEVEGHVIMQQPQGNGNVSIKSDSRTQILLSGILVLAGLSLSA